MTEIDEDVLKGLGAKLDSLDLSDAERVVLDGILARAEAYEPEVEGFAFDSASYSFSGQRSGAGLSGTSLKLGGGLGFVTRPRLGYGDSADPTGDPDWPPKP